MSISFRIAALAPTNAMKLSDLMSERKNLSDIQITVKLPDGRRESKFISRDILSQIQEIEIIMIRGE